MEIRGDFFFFYFEQHDKRDKIVCMETFFLLNGMLHFEEEIKTND